MALMLAAAMPASAQGVFNRIATFPVFMNTDIDNETVAEIVAVAEQGNLLIYTDSELEALGFVSIIDPTDPQPAGTLPLPGEPTSVAVAGDYALVAVVTDDTFTDPDGDLMVVHIPTRAIVRTMNLGGQPDAVAVSPDGRWAAVVLENERDEELCVGGVQNGQPVDEDDDDAVDACEDGGGVVGGLPQLPSGELVVVDLFGSPALWKTKVVSLAGIADKFPTDAEPEFVDISETNIAAVTLQENNHIVLVDLPTATVVGDFPAGTVDLTEIDTEEEGVITFNSSLADVPREPDAVTWISRTQLATADEGDLDGGSRGFTIYNTAGSVLFTSGSMVEHQVARLGHYPEERSGNKGSEPEGVASGVFGSQRFLFVGSERASVILVYTVDRTGTPAYVQTLPAGLEPEGIVAIPERNLLVVATEEDDRGDKFRGSIMIYEHQFEAEPAYPTIFSVDRADGTPIPWAALSGLAADPLDRNTLYAVQDSFFSEAKMFVVDVSGFPARITDDVVIRDADGNPMMNLDLEGIATRPLGYGFWLASEGRGSVDDPNRPVESLDLLLEVSPIGEVLQAIELPAATNAFQRRFGFEGVTSTGIGEEELVYVAFQREWVGDPDDHVRIGRYEVATGEWTFFYYPIETPTSPNGGWVGLSDIVAVDDETLAVVERDNQGGPDARIKRIYSFSIAGLEPQPEGGDFPVVTKSLIRDLIPDLESGNGFVIEKVEGLSLQTDGNVFIATDNDGVDDSNGETKVINLGPIL